MALLCKEKSRPAVAALNGRPGLMARPGREPSAARLNRSVLRLGVFRRGKVDLDPCSARIEEEQLPQPRGVAGRRQPAQVVFDPALLELGHIGRRVGSEKGDVVEHPAALRNDRLFDDMQHRLAAVIEPGAREREVRPRPGGQSEDVVIESDRLFSVGGENGEMIHPIDRHGSLLPYARKRTNKAWARVLASDGGCQVDNRQKLEFDTRPAPGAGFRLMEERSDGELGILARRRIEAEIIAPVYDEMRKAVGEDKARDILRRAIRRAAIDAGAEMAARAAGGADLESFKAILPLWTKDDALTIEVIDDKPGVLDFNVRRCRYSETYRAMGLGDIGDILSCNRDGAFCEGYDPRIKLTRTQTIMGGASHCDFRYRADPPQKT